ncbi:hypothetical protein [Micavibrio aeruginosavorus]|uniref:hypothetical protein n=1 Tax=Micavibrio aeruginosavorus TaxID=349221 RepID=UPI003F4AAE1C
MSKNPFNVDKALALFNTLAPFLADTFGRKEPYIVALPTDADYDAANDVLRHTEDPTIKAACTMINRAGQGPVKYSMLTPGQDDRAGYVRFQHLDLAQAFQSAMRHKMTTSSLYEIDANGAMTSLRMVHESGATLNMRAKRPRLQQ